MEREKAHRAFDAPHALSAVWKCVCPASLSLSLSCLSLSLSFFQDSERKGFMNKLYVIQDVCISVQNALDEVASYGERIKK